MKYNANAVYSMRIDNVSFGDIIKMDNRAFAVCLTPDVLQRGSIQRMLVIRLKPVGKTDIVKRTKEDRETSIYIQLYGDRYVADITNIESIRKENIDQYLGTLSRVGIGHLQSLLYHYFRMDDCEEVALARAKYDIQRALCIEEADVHNMIPCVVVSYDDEAAPATVEDRVRIIKEALEGDKSLVDTLKALKELPVIKPEKPEEKSTEEPDKKESFNDAVQAVMPVEDEPGPKVDNIKYSSIKPNDTLKAVMKEVEVSDTIENVIEDEPKEVVEPDDTADGFEEEVDMDKLEPSIAELQAIEDEEKKKRAKKKKPVVIENKPFVKPVRTSHNKASNLMSIMNTAASTKPVKPEDDTEIPVTGSKPVKEPEDSVNLPKESKIKSATQDGVYGRVSNLSDEVIITALKDRDTMSNKEWCIKYNVCSTNQYTKLRALEKEAAKRNLKIEE